MKRSKFQITLGFALACAAFTPTLAVCAQAQTYTFSTLYSFKNNGSDPASPVAAPTVDDSGNLYGTSNGGGTLNQGAVFQVTPNGTLTVLHSFGAGADSGYLSTGLLRDRAGNLYGTTLFTVFRLAPSGEETFLFAVPSTNFTPQPSDLILDFAGNLYGMATGAGNQGTGSVFEIDASGAYSTLYTFCAKSGCPDGEFPVGRLARDSAGNLYGTVYSGVDRTGVCAGTGCGGVFKLTPDGVESLLHNFERTDGMNPFGLTRDKVGNLYGVTNQGISNDKGTVFKLPLRGGALKTLYQFCSRPGCADGYSPVGPAQLDNAGNVYGIASYSTRHAGSVVWKVDAEGNETALYTFPSHVNSYGGIAIDTAGNLYGFTYNGGTAGLGSVFKLTLKK